MSQDISIDASAFSTICIDRCKGRCCDPWWGIVSYQVRKTDGLSKLTAFRTELINGIKVREKRIRENYVTSEVPAKDLFKTPDKYNVSIESIKIHGSNIIMHIRAMYAFRCLFLAGNNECGIHPYMTGTEDIRPPYCGYMGSIRAKEGEKGFCRTIHAAARYAGDVSKVDEAIDVEASSSDKFYNDGCNTVEDAADKLIEQIRSYCLKNAPQLSITEKKEAKPGRNDPCWCGSEKKYKKCHG